MAVIQKNSNFAAAMSGLDTYTIDLRGIHATAVRFDYPLDDRFFELLDQNEILGGDLTATVSLREVIADIYELTFHIEGRVAVTCDRCLERLELPVAVDTTFKLKDGDEADETDDIKCAPLGTNCYNVAWDLYELIETSLPILRAHDEGDCNPDMMSHLYEGLN